MDFQTQSIDVVGKKITIIEDGEEIARAFLYVLHNELHKEPFGFIEDVLVDENYRGRGIGTKLITEVIAEAKRQGCYKLIATSRYSNEKAHKFYDKLGFKNHGAEFRMDL